MSWWKAQGQKLKDLLELYGGVAFVVWFSIFLLTLFGFWTAISAGFDIGSTAGSVGTFWAAYAATQLTKPVRIAITVVLTPIVARLYVRFRGGELPQPAPVSSDDA